VAKKNNKKNIKVAAGYSDQEQVISALMAYSPEEFEDFILDLLYEVGYGVSYDSVKKNNSKTRDNGIDGYIELDPLGIEKLYVQSKRWGNPIRSQQVHDFSGAFDAEGGHKGILVTPSYFTPDAYKTSKKIKNKFLKLLDGNEPARLILSKNTKY
jgi:restriction system protein